MQTTENLSDKIFFKVLIFQLVSKKMPLLPLFIPCDNSNKFQHWPKSTSTKAPREKSFLRTKYPNPTSTSCTVFIPLTLDYCLRKEMRKNWRRTLIVKEYIYLTKWSKWQDIWKLEKTLITQIMTRGNRKLSYSLLTIE